MLHYLEKWSARSLPTSRWQCQQMFVSASYNMNQHQHVRPLKTFTKYKNANIDIMEIQRFIIPTLMSSAWQLYKSFGICKWCFSFSIDMRVGEYHPKTLAWQWTIQRLKMHFLFETRDLPMSVFRGEKRSRLRQFGVPIIYFDVRFFFTRSVSGCYVFFNFEFLFTTGTQNRTAGVLLTKLNIKFATV